VFLLLPGSVDAFLNPNLSTTLSRDVSSVQLNLFGFLKDAKKNLVKSLAGEYDEVAVKARIAGDVSNNSVLMYSFTT